MSITAMDDRLRVLHVFRKMDRGGAELRAVEMMAHLDPRYEQHFCIHSGGSGLLDEEIAARGGRIHYLPLGPTFAWRFLRLLKRERIGVVHAHTQTASAFFLRLAAMAGVPGRVAHFHTSGDGWRGTWRRRLSFVLRYRWMDRWANGLVHVSRSVQQSIHEEAARYLRGRTWNGDPRSQVIYDGIDVPRLPAAADRAEVLREFGLPDDSRLYLHVGNMTAAKNHPRLLRIYRAIARRDARARFLVVGGGDARQASRLRELAASLKIAARTAFTGTRTDAARLLGAADALIFPSLWEGLPGVVLEAAALGTPVVASDLPVIREMAAHLSSLHPHALDQDDETWAATAVRVAHGTVGEQSRKAARAEFARSPFLAVCAARGHEAVWRSCIEEIVGRRSA